MTEIGASTTRALLGESPEEVTLDGMMMTGFGFPAVGRTWNTWAEMRIQL